MSTPAAGDLTADSAQQRLARAKEASRSIARLTSGEKGAALESIARAIESNVERIVAANGLDIEHGRENAIGDALIDRLRLDEKRVTALASAVRDVAALPDPIGQVLGGHRMPNGIALEASWWTLDATGRPADFGDERLFSDPDPVPAVVELRETGQVAHTVPTRLVDEITRDLYKPA